MSTRLPAPAVLTEVAARVDQRLGAVLAEQSAHWSAVDPRLTEAIDELNRMTTSGGKRLRAAFCYWAWRGLRDEPDTSDSAAIDSPAISPAIDSAGIDSTVIDIGAAFEFLQVFALIHDDIMDGSPTRRGAKTVHVANAERVAANGWRGEPRRFGDGVAILVGDLGHVYADQLTGAISPAGRRLWDTMRIELNLGQYLDMRSAAAGDLDAATARLVATFKTALYTIVRPLQIGVSIDGEAPASLLDELERFGRPVGQAFQLRDDALGLLGDEESLGKPVGDDLREGKPTGLLAHATARANRAQAQVLARVGRPDLDADDIADLVTVLADTGAIANNEAEIDRLVTEALEVLEGVGLSVESRKALAELTRFVAHRTH